MVGEIDAEIREFKRRAFNGGWSPPRSYLQFFMDATRWPVDAYASHTATNDQQQVTHQLTWIKGQIIGEAQYVDLGPTAEPTVSVHIHPLHRISRVEIGADRYDAGFVHDVSASIVVTFDDGTQLNVNPSRMSNGPQREQAELFIWDVLNAVGLLAGAGL